jgi:hypothetical protein
MSPTHTLGARAPAFERSRFLVLLVCLVGLVGLHASKTSKWLRRRRARIALPAPEAILAYALGPELGLF